MAKKIIGKNKKKARSSADIDAFMQQVKKMEKGEKLDLSSDEDLSIGIMNLISIEEHLAFTYNKTENNQYLELLEEVRSMRKELLKRIIKDYEGEVWCISKHLLSGSMRMMEVGTKALSKGDKKDAESFFQKSYQLYSLFWGLNLGFVGKEQLVGSKKKNNYNRNSQKIAEERIEFISESGKTLTSSSIFAKMGELVKRAVDCCRE